MATQRIETTDGQGNVLEVREVDVVDGGDPVAEVVAAIDAATDLDELKAVFAAYITDGAS